jgi:hypothetical protein
VSVDGTRDLFIKKNDQHGIIAHFARERKE